MAVAADDAWILGLLGRDMSSITTAELFDLRMRRERRYKEYKRRAKERFMSPEGGYLTGSKTHWETRREFGFRSREEEVKLAQRYIMDVNREVEKETNRRKQNTCRAKKGSKDILSRMDELGLPHNADAKVTMDWIASHPAMTRAQHPKATENTLALTPRDIDESCPSRAAVNALQRFMFAPDKFYDNWMSEAKKQVGKAADDGQEEAMDDMANVDRILRETL